MESCAFIMFPDSKELLSRRIAHSVHFKALFPFKITMCSGTLFLVVVTLAFTSASCFPLLADDSWDHFVFAQFWPQSQCYPMSEEGQPLVGFVANSSCVPTGVKKWTIHGLWPTVQDEEPKPGYCNKSWPFDMAQVEDLKTRLQIQWPSYESPANPESFWKHEWEKHGTCATSLSSMDSEHKFFSIGLALNTQFDLYGVLAQGGIVPSDSTSYKVNDIESAITKVFDEKSRVCCQDVKGNLHIVDTFEDVEDEKDLIPALDKQGWTSAILVDSKKNPKLKAATVELDQVDVLHSLNLSVYPILLRHNIVLSLEAVRQLEERLCEDDRIIINQFE